MPKPNVRLPQHISPQKYELTIRPDLESFTFTAEETIDVMMAQSDASITLHSKLLEVLDGHFIAGKSRIDISKITYNAKVETVTLSFAKPLPKGKGKLYLDFRGIISENLRGFYRSQYTHKGKTKHLATTQFEATDARRAFPCFDEPAHKAVFEITLIIPKHLTAISNTIETPTPKGVEHDPGFKVVKFAPTPKMSTYLLAYTIGDFESIQSTPAAKGKTKKAAGAKQSTTVRIFTTPGKKQHAKFALNVATRTLDFLNEYFAIPYPLPVLDLIAIPDFAAAAMENWGAVTFRESALLVDEKNTAFANKQHIAEVIAHELVHQWFGNLVTMEWWTHLWLNESFASFMSYVVLDELFPEWNIWTRFVMHDHASALELDSLDNTHPIEVEVNHPDQISEIFDAISYDKGASVLRMLQHYIGNDKFRDGLRYYLKKHSYKNTESVHLWDAFEKVSKKPINAFMKQWITKPGYPIISVLETKTGILRVSQERFNLKQKKNDRTIWPIPLQFELKKDELSAQEVLNTKFKEFKVSADNIYIKSNPQETGFFRTLYSPSLLAKLCKPIAEKQLAVTDRFGIIRDIFAMVKSDRLPTSVYLEFLSAYKNEDSYIVWTEILGGMREIYNLTSDDAVLQKNIAKHYLHVLKNIVETVGWEVEHKESQARTLLRGSVLHAFGMYGDKKTIAHAEKLFAYRGRKPISPDLRSAVYALNSINADVKKATLLQQLFTKETLQEEQRRIGRALMSFKHPKLFIENLDFALSKHVRSQDAALLIANAFQNSVNKSLAWKWLQKNWPTIKDRYGNDHILTRIIEAFNCFVNPAMITEIEQFFKENPLPVANRALKQSAEHIRLNAAWFKRDKKDIAHCINQGPGL